MVNYTIDVRSTASGWSWRLYDQGGARSVTRGYTGDIEGALNRAENALLIHHRTGEVATWIDGET